MRIPAALTDRLSTGGRLACAAVLGLTLAAFGATPAMAGDSSAPAVDSLSQLLGTVEDEADELLDDEAQEGFVGTWTLIGMGSEDDELQLGAGMFELMGDFGFEMVFQIEDDGTFSMKVTAEGEEESVEGTWTELGDEAVFTVEGEDVTVAMNEDGTFSMSEDGITMTFGRASDVAAGKFAADTSDQYVADPQGFLYTWKLVALDLPGDENDVPEELFSLAEMFGVAGVLNLTDDGVFTLSMTQGEGLEAEVVEGYWEQVAEDQVQLGVEDVDGTLTAMLADGRLLLSDPEDAETMLVFAALTPEAAAGIVATGVQAYYGDWFSVGLVGEGVDGIEALDADYGLFVYDDGTFDITYDDGPVHDSASGAWAYDEQWDEMRFTANGSDQYAFVDGDELYMEYDSSTYLVFAR